jgi:branched-chain amino acid transport system ATP-binding protein
MNEAAGHLIVADLHAGYGSMEAVAGISLEVRAGETVAMLGRNGAGKTTALLAIAGLRYGRFSGSIVLSNVDVSRFSAAQIVKAGLAHVPEGHRIFQSLTVQENLRLGAYARRREGRRTLQVSMASVFDLFPILRKYASRSAGFLSGGEQQMLAIGQALMADPKVLMLDEPTSGLSQIVIRDILRALSQLREQGLAILLVEQSVPRALANSDRCYVMERGCIVLSGPSDALAADERVGAIVRGTQDVELTDDRGPQAKRSGPPG